MAMDMDKTDRDRANLQHLNFYPRHRTGVLFCPTEYNAIAT